MCLTSHILKSDFSESVFYIIFILRFYYFHCKMSLRLQVFNQQNLAKAPISNRCNLLEILKRISLNDLLTYCTHFLIQCLLIIHLLKAISCDQIDCHECFHWSFLSLLRCDLDVFGYSNPLKGKSSEAYFITGINSHFISFSRCWYFYDIPCYF